MPKILVSAGWDGLSPLSAEDIVTRVPPVINIEAHPKDSTRMFINDRDLRFLQNCLKNFGIIVRPF